MTNRSPHLRPSCRLDEIVADSRFVQKLQESILELIDDTLLDALESGEIIDTKYDASLEDEELEAYEMKRSQEFMDLVFARFVASRQ